MQPNACSYQVKTASTSRSGKRHLMGRSSVSRCEALLPSQFMPLSHTILMLQVVCSHPDNTIVTELRKNLRGV